MITPSTIPLPSDEHDKGHRYGNFHSYYSFNPTEHRLDVLKETRILPYLQEHLVRRRASRTCQEQGVSSGSSSPPTSRLSKRKLVTINNDVGDGQDIIREGIDHAITNAENDTNHNGDDAHNTNKQVNIISEEESGSMKGDTKDNQRAKRIKYEDKVPSMDTRNVCSNINTDTQEDKEDIKGESSCTKQRREIFYCDLGCNEGDLTMSLARSLQRDVTHPHTCHFHCLGLDVDTELIQRAKDKNITKDKEVGTSIPTTTATFQVCNIGDPKEHKDSYNAFFQRPVNSEKGVVSPQQSPQSSSSPSVPSFDLTTIFSTTMWIHIHGGDEGLTEFLKRACSFTEFLLIEPQPSKCYRSANIRLRKMGRPEIDVSPSRLQLRQNIEEEIENIICSCGFVKVSCIDEEQSSSESMDTTRTAWNRCMQLYRREVASKCT